MKIKNDYIKIKNGKTYEFRNTITSEYLQLFSKGQYDENYKKKSNNKALKYVYIKTGDIETEEKGNNNKSYYNLIDANSIETMDSCFTKKAEFDWFTFDGNNVNEETEAIIKFIDKGLIQKGDDYRILLEISNITRPQNLGLTFRVAEKEFSISILPNQYEQVLSVTARYGNSITIDKNTDGKYLFALHRNNYGKYSNDANIYIQSANGNLAGVSFDFRISLIKEENTQDYVEQLSFDDYLYNEFVSSSDLVAKYNYRLPVTKSSCESSNSVVDTYYSFDNMSGYYKSDGLEFIQTTNINEMANKQILQLAFGDENTIYAFIDISESDISIAEDEGLFIYRKDIVVSDAIFSGDLIPAHLCPLGCKIDSDICYAELYSIGLGFTNGIMNEEYLISENPVEQIDDITFRITLEKGIDDTLTPNESIFPNDNLFPILETHLVSGFYPSKDLYPNENIYPILGNYKYIIYKYKFFWTDGTKVFPVEKYYTMSFYTENKGTTRVDTKYERS